MHVQKYGVSTLRIIFTCNKHPRPRSGSPPRVMAAAVFQPHHRSSPWIDNIDPQLGHLCHHHPLLQPHPPTCACTELPRTYQTNTKANTHTLNFHPLEALKRTPARSPNTTLSPPPYALSPFPPHQNITLSHSPVLNFPIFQLPTHVPLRNNSPKQAEMRTPAHNASKPSPAPSTLASSLAPILISISPFPFHAPLLCAKVTPLLACLPCQRYNTKFLRLREKIWRRGEGRFYAKHRWTRRRGEV